MTDSANTSKVDPRYAASREAHAEWRAAKATAEQDPDTLKTAERQLARALLEDM